MEYIKFLEINNFKHLNNFQVNNFGKVNLIGGKNNIGKTSLMEALYINIYSKTFNNFLQAIADIYYYRVHKQDLKLDEIFFNIDDIEIITNLNKLKFNIEKKDARTIVNIQSNFFDIKENKNKIDLNPIKNNKVTFLETNLLSDKQLKEFYKYVQLKDEEYKIDEFLQEFDNNIKKFKFVGDVPKIKLQSDEFIDLYNFGEGTKRMISFICALFKSENGVLFIDEIENGIWYKNMEIVWEVIFELAYKLNIQVFITTHSKESISAFNKIQQKYENSFYCEMYKNIKENKIEMRFLDFKQLKYELTHNGEFRGE